jgi:hypothetical protein
MPAMARVVRAGMPMFRLFEFEADLFDFSLNVTQNGDPVVVFDEEPFGGVRDIRRQHARRLPDGFFNRVTVLRRFQPDHVPYLLAIALRDLSADRVHERRHLRQRHPIMVIVYADFGAAAVAPQVYIGDACASFEEQFEFFEPAEFIRFAGDDDSELQLASLPAGLRLPRADITFAVFVMVVMVIVVMTVMIVIVIAMMMIVAVIAFFAVRMTFVGMRFGMRVAVIVIAFGAMLMFRFVIVIAFRPVDVMFFVK